MLKFYFLTRQRKSVQISSTSLLLSSFAREPKAISLVCKTWTSLPSPNRSITLLATNFAMNLSFPAIMASYAVLKAS